MRPPARDRIVVGLGQASAGDDAVGLLVARVVAARGLLAIESCDATIVLSLLLDGREVVLVDALVCPGGAGRVLTLQPDELASKSASLSSHGISVARSLALASVLRDIDVTSIVDVVGVTVEGRPRPGDELSPAVAAAVEPAATLASWLARRAR